MNAISEPDVLAFDTLHKLTGSNFLGVQPIRKIGHIPIL